MKRGARRSLWEQTAPPTETGPLTGDATADVCIIGAGIAGMSAAYQANREGLSVVVLDDGPVGGGNTARTTAHLASALDDRFSALEKLRGEDAARLAAASHSAAIAEVERICEAEGIECGFERLDGYLFNPPGGDPEELKLEYEAAQRAGLKVELELRAPIAFDTGPALRFRDQGQFHPLEYLRGLERVVTGAGVRVHTGTRATDVGTEGGLRVVTKGGAVSAGAVVVATNTPISDRFAIHTKQAPYLSYVIGAEIERGAVPSALYWDTLDPYHYVRLARGPGDHDVLIVGGEDHKTGQAQDMRERYERLEAWTRERFPIGAVRQRWSGQVYETLDGLAYIGRDPGGEGLYVSTGDSGMGMTHGTIAGLLLRDLIAGRENPWQALYEPSRKVVGGAHDFARENINVLSQYADWLKGGEVGTRDEVGPGSGALLRQGVKYLALYRDASGTLFERSAVCPHLGCLVAWNPDEASWDCPCHGSRFGAKGELLNGPANRDLGEP